LASRRSVFALRRSSSGRAIRLHDDDAPDMRSEDAGHPERDAGRLERHLVIVAEALREQLELLGCGLDAARRADLAVLGDRDLAEVAVDVKADEAHLASFIAGFDVGDQTGERQPRIRARGTAG
jgi:hypothetical protein